MPFRSWALIVACLALHAADLAHRIDSAVEQSPVARRASIGIRLVDLKTGKTLYGRNENLCLSEIRIRLIE
jgi:hypothetical protein